MGVGIKVKVLVTGGAGFIGRWVVGRLLEDGHRVWVLDNLSNGSEKNLMDYTLSKGFEGLTIGDIKDKQALELLFSNKFDICYHLAASINVQDSLNDPRSTYCNDVEGTFEVLECCRKHWVKIVFMSTCMVYDCVESGEGITETHKTKPASPYAGSKIAGENMVLSYWYGYGLPVVVIRPFNTYGPYQKSSGEGGVVSIFVDRARRGLPLNIYGDGTQTRDLIYVEDCANFVVLAGYSNLSNGEVINAGLGKDISINDLAVQIAGLNGTIVHVPHIHQQSEIKRLLCNYGKAKGLLGWEPKIPLCEGVDRMKKWLEETN